MSHTQCAVTIKQLPGQITTHHARLFLRELRHEMDVERPCIVLDCSRILQMDIPAIKLLLDCLEDAMKHNGDIKLASMREPAKAMLQITGVDRLFEVFDTNSEAVKSYHRLSFPSASQDSAPSGKSHLAAENAA